MLRTMHDTREAAFGDCSSGAAEHLELLAALEANNEVSLH